MKSAVIINLDYERHDAAVCRRIWEEIDRGMQAAGFARHFRIFLADMDRQTCCDTAKDIVAGVEATLALEGIPVFDVIREFYWFEYQQINDLLAPANEIPEVSIVSMDDFHQFMNTSGS